MFSHFVDVEVNKTYGHDVVTLVTIQENRVFTRLLSRNEIIPYMTKTTQDNGRVRRFFRKVQV